MTLPGGSRIRLGQVAVTAFLAWATSATLAWADGDGPRVALQAPRAGDGLDGRVTIAGDCTPPGETIEVELLDGEGRRIASASTPCLAGVAGAGKFRRALDVAGAGTFTGRLRAGIRQGGFPIVEVEEPVVFLGPLRELTQRMLRALASGDSALLTAHAAPDYVEVVVPDRPDEPGSPLSPARIEPLLVWARRQLPVTVRRVTALSNRHGDGYQVVVLELAGGFFSVGWECTGALAGRGAVPQVTKVFATLEAVPWD